MLTTLEPKQSFHLIVIVTNKQKSSYTYLQTAPEYKKSGKTTNRTIKSNKKKTIHIIPTNTNNKFQQQ